MEMYKRVIVSEIMLAAWWWISVGAWFGEVRTGLLFYIAGCALVWQYDALAGSGAVAVVQLVAGGDAESANGSSQPRALALVRLCAQWFASVFGFGMMLGWFPSSFDNDVPAPLKVAGVSFWTALALQVVAGGLHGAFLLRRADGNVLEDDEADVFWRVARSGVFLMFFVFPWACPQNSLTATLWMTRVYRLTSLFSAGSAVFVLCLQSVLAYGVWNVMHWEAYKARDAEKTAKQE